MKFHSIDMEEREVCGRNELQKKEFDLILQEFQVVDNMQIELQGDNFDPNAI